MKRNWTVLPAADQGFLLRNPTLSPLVAQLLYNRSLTEPEAIRAFLDPRYEDLPSPFLLRDMAKATARIKNAVQSGEKICIYGDYDADAVTANALLQQAFRFMGTEVLSYIPDRFTEGYGVNLEAVRKLKEAGCRLIITVDCGTNSVEVADYCASAGVDFIVTDHHEIIGPEPSAYALINPKNPAEKYPWRELTGVGVAFKLACALLQEPPAGVTVPKGSEKWLLDLVAIGTVADCHSLMGENRILVKFGLKVLAKTRWPGLRALMAVSGCDPAEGKGSLDTYSLGYVLAPRLNAAGRLEHADTALHLLVDPDAVSARQRAEVLEKINSKRQQITAQVLSEAREQAVRYLDRKVLVLLGQDWPKGVVGLVAGRLAEEFGKPAIVLDRAEDVSTGSARSSGEFDVIEALKAASNHLTRFGGHKQAAGLTLKTAEYEDFYAKVLSYAELHQADLDSGKDLFLEAELGTGQINCHTVKELESFQPFGVGNSKPRFLIRGLQIVGLRLVGAMQQHLQMKLRSGNDQWQGIWFGAGEAARSLEAGEVADAAVELVLDYWQGREQLKLKVVDIRKI